MIDINKIPSPCYVMEEKLLRNNLSLIKSVKERAGVNIRGPVGLRGDGKSGAYLFPGLYGG